MYARITGTGHYLPQHRLTNHDLEQRVDTSDIWIRERTGIRERRIAGPDENVVTMATAASHQALQAAGLDPAKLDMIVMATTSSEQAFPSAACQLQHSLGVSEIPAFDVGAACAGFMFALSIADQYIRTGNARHILVVGADVLARLCNPQDRNTTVLFGDGAGAVILSADSEAGILSTHLYSAGEFADLLGSGHLPAEREQGWLYMKGSEVFKVAVNKLSQLVSQTLQHNNLSQADLDWLIPHQANRRIIEATAKKLSMSMEQVVMTLEHTGNTSAASVPIALDWAVRDGRIQRGQRLLLEAFGGGFAWGSALVVY